MTDQTPASSSAEVFSFGDPERVLDARDIMSYMKAWWNDNYYEPPVSLSGLARSYRVNAHHASAIQVKKNILVKTYIEHPKLSKLDFTKIVMDFLILGNCYPTRVRNRLGGVLKYESLPAKYARVGKGDKFFFVPGWGEEIEQETGSVFHLMEPDINQEIYGLPEYLGAMQSAFLNESATLFRRRYYDNSGHSGYILHITDSAYDNNDIEGIKEQLKQSKGQGNFKNLFLYTPNGKKDGVQVIPLSEVTAKDEFFNMKNVTRDDVMAAHRVPWQMMSMMPPINSSSSGTPSDVARVFAANEINPLQAQLASINTWAEEELIRFEPYEITGLEVGGSLAK